MRFAGGVGRGEALRRAAQVCGIGGMQVHARISKEWRRRMLFMGAMIWGSGLWFLYDGYVAWPDETRRHAEFDRMAQAMVASGKAAGVKDVAVTRAWEQAAAEKGWSTDVPKRRTEGDIAGQRIIGWSFVGAGVLFAAWLAWNHTRSVRAEGDVITGAGGEQVRFDEIVGVDRRKWEDKGIAYAIYERNGKRRRLTLDDHKFLGCEAIIVEAERRIAARKQGTPEREGAA